MIKNDTVDHHEAAAGRSMPIDHEVCVIGGGPSGLICALMLARSGFNTALVAPQTVSNDGRTTAILHSSAEILNSLEIWPSLEGIAAPLRKMRLVDDTGRLIRAPETTFDSSELGLEAFGYNLLNSEMVEILQTRAAALDELTIYDTVADAVGTEESRATVSLRSGPQITCRLAVGADGRQSIVRNAARITVRDWKYPQSALVVNLRHTLPHNDISTEFHTPTGPFTLVPLKGNRSSLVCVERPETAERLKQTESEALALELEMRAKSILGRFELDSSCQVFPLSGMTAQRVGQNRCALIGEAAHVFPPIGAQGLNLGLRDVAWLGETVTRVRRGGHDIGCSETLSSYNQSRMNDIRTRTSAVDLLNRTLLTGFLPVQTARSLGLYMAGRIGPLRRIMMREGITPMLSSPRLAKGLPLAG